MYEKERESGKCERKWKEYKRYWENGMWNGKILARGKNRIKSSVADPNPDPNPRGSELFLVETESESEIFVPDSDSDPDLDPVPDPVIE